MTNMVRGCLAISVFCLAVFIGFVIAIACVENPVGEVFACAVWLFVCMCALGIFGYSLAKKNAEGDKKKELPPPKKLYLKGRKPPEIPPEEEENTGENRKPSMSAGEEAYVWIWVYIAVVVAVAVFAVIAAVYVDS